MALCVHVVGLVVPCLHVISQRHVTQWGEDLPFLGLNVFPLATAMENSFQKHGSTPAFWSVQLIVDRWSSSVDRECLFGAHYLVFCRHRGF